MLRLKLEINKIYAGDAQLRVTVEGKEVKLCELQQYENHLSEEVYNHLFNFVTCHPDMHSLELKQAIARH
ncbi:MAG: hypothetical protein ACK5N8_02145 [Alphaproteobacteria bacterium]